MAEHYGDGVEGIFGKQRRNVLLIGIALFAYYFAGGALDRDVRLPIIGIQLTESERIIWLLWIVLAYCTWRYSLQANPYLKHLREQLTSYLQNDPYLQALADGNYQQSNQARYQAMVQELEPSSLRVDLRTLVRQGIGVSSIQYKGHLVAARERVFREDASVPIELELPTWAVVWRWWAIFSKRLWSDKTVQDYLVPYVVVVAALIMAGIRVVEGSGIH
jgi:hypothetical protein